MTSQYGEDASIKGIFAIIGEADKTFVEIGWAPEENNTSALIERGWTGFRFDQLAYEGVTAVVRMGTHNVAEILTAFDVPRDFDFLSIDIDGQDYYLWETIARWYRPRVVCIEYNPYKEHHYLMGHDNGYRWDERSQDFGASLFAMQQLARRLGYSYLSRTFCNAFFVRD